MIRDLVEKSRSYRGYDEGVRLTREQLEGFVDCARLCPSSINRQPLKYYLAWEPEKVSLIQGFTKWAAALPNMTLPHPGKCPTAFIVVCQDTSIDADPQRYQRDVGIVAQTILLAAVEQGYGGCMIGNFRGGPLREALQLPDAIRPMLVIALGKPDEKVVLTEVSADGDTGYYRDENDVHYVPKRTLEEELLN